MWPSLEELKKKMKGAVAPLFGGGAPSRAPTRVTAPPDGPMSRIPAASATPIADSLYQKYSSMQAAPEARPLDRPSVLSDADRRAAERVAAIQKKTSPFLKTIFGQAREGIQKGAAAAEEFIVDQGRAIAEFGSGKYGITPKDVGDGMYKTGVGTLKVTEALAKGFNEGVLRFGTSIADAALPGYKEQRKASDTTALQSVAGVDEIKSLQDMFSGMDGWAKEKGATETGAKTFAGFGVLGAIFMDWPGVGSASKVPVKLTKTLIEDVAKSTDEAAIREIVKTANPDLPDKALDFMTPVFRNASTPEEVNTAIRMVNGAAKNVTRKVDEARIVEGAKGTDIPEELLPLADDARKFDNAEDFTRSVSKSEFRYDDSVKTDATLGEVPMSRFDGEDIRASQNTVDVAGVKKWEKRIEAGERPRVLVEMKPDGPRIIDGHTRLNAYKNLGIEEIPVIDNGGVLVEGTRLDEFHAKASKAVQQDLPAPAIAPMVAERIPRDAPINPNLIKNLGESKDPWEVLNVLKNEYPALPDQVVDRMVRTFIRTKRIPNVENLIRAARNLNETFKVGGIRPAGVAEGAADSLPKASKEILDRTTNKTVRKLMSQSQKENMIRTLQDKFENPKDAVAAEGEYNRIWDDLDQKVVDEFENLSMQKSFLEDALDADSEGISAVFKKLFMGPNKKNAADDTIMELQEIHNRAVRKRNAVENYRKFGASGDKLYPGNPGKLSKTDEYAVLLDSYLVDAGIKDGDWSIAQERIERYARLREEVKALTERIKELKPRVREARILQKGLDDIAIIPQKDVEVIDRIVTPGNLRDNFNDIAGHTIYTRDLTRNFEKFFGRLYPKIKKAVLDPFDASKAARVDDVVKVGDDLEENIVKKYGIRRGSKESAAIQRYGDTDLPAPERLDYDGLVKEFGKEKADNIVAADKWFRGEYDRLIDELNVVRKKIYPNNPSKLIAKRSNYYRHYREMSETWGEAIREFFDTPSGIAPILVGKSEFTKPKSKFLSLAEERLGQKTDLDAVGGFMNYAELYAYAKHIDPHVTRFRYLHRKVAEASPRKGEELTLPDGTKYKAKGSESFLKFLDAFSRDLTGNTNPVDRLVQDIIPGGRATIRTARFINNRMKANSVLANFGSMMAQVANVPAGIADTKLYAGKGAQRTIASIFTHNEPMSQSTFIKERYQKYLSERFPFQFSDKPLRATGDMARKQAAWLMQKADEVGTKFVWNSEYEKALGIDAEDPVKYADDATRKIVAGRGIGEVPLGQKALLTQFAAPFTLEVGNALWIMKGWLNKKEYAALATFFVANYVLNEVAERTRGSRIVVDPINALWEGSISLVKEWKAGTPGRGALKALGRLAGEALANVPGGQTIAAGTPEEAVKFLTEKATGAPMTKRDLFGNSTAGRFGTPLIVSGLQDAVYRLLPPVGGVQLKKTIDGVMSLIRGHAENKEGEETFQVPASPQNVARALLFGSGATSEARKYYEERQDLFEATSREEAEEFVRSANAEDVYSKFQKKLGKGKGAEAADYLAAEAEKDPLMAKAIIDIIKDEKNGLGPNDRLVKMLGVNSGARAEYIHSQLQEIKDPDARADYLASLAEKKLLTADVMRQLAVLMAK